MGMNLDNYCQFGVKFVSIIELADENVADAETFSMHTPV
jgi:hypothetical protein